MKIGSDIAGFDIKMSDKKDLDKAKEDAKYGASESANGFPSLIIRNENQKAVLSNGYVSFEPIDAQLSQLF
ncbi:MAG: protein-disulfide isomerase-like protein with CxxC motif [Vicingaceae bacterium]